MRKYAVKGSDAHKLAWDKDPNKYKSVREHVLYDRVLHTTEAGTENELDGLSAETGLFNSQVRCTDGKRCNIGPTPGVLPAGKDLTVYAFEAEIASDDIAAFRAMAEDLDLVLEDSDGKEIVRRRLRECPQIGGVDGYHNIDGNASAEEAKLYRNGIGQAFAVPLPFPIALKGGNQVKAKLKARGKAAGAASEPFAVVNAYAGPKTLEIRWHCLEYTLTKSA